MASKKTDIKNGITKDRSPQWPSVERKFKKIQPTCQACGTNKKLNVHHIKPFHLFPELELVESNLITLCMEKECHLKLGHSGNFKAYNPDVVQDVSTVKNDITLFEQVVKTAKSKILFG